MSALADEPNVVVKVSGLGLRGHEWTVQNNRWIVKETIAMFGPARALFAGQLPRRPACAARSAPSSATSHGRRTLVALGSATPLLRDARAVYRTASPSSRCAPPRGGKELRRVTLSGRPRGPASPARSRRREARCPLGAPAERRANSRPSTQPRQAPNSSRFSGTRFARTRAGDPFPWLGKWSLNPLRK